MKVQYQEQTVTLRIRRGADGTPPAEWDWPALLDEPFENVELLDASPIKLYEKEVEGE